MTSLLKLPIRALDLATLPTRFVVRRAVGLVQDVLGSDGDGSRATTPPTYEPPAASAPAPPATPAKPAPARRRRATPAKPATKAARRAARGEPTRGQAAAIREREREREQAAGGPGPGPEIDVAPPWEGYDAMTEEQVLDRLTGADQALRAAVRLYEQAYGNRRQVLIATEDPAAQP